MVFGIDLTVTLGADTAPSLVAELQQVLPELGVAESVKMQ